MPENGNDIISESVMRYLAYDRGGPNHDIYDKRLTTVPPTPEFDYVPHCVYFYYVRIEKDGRVRVDHYFYANGALEDPTSWQPIPYVDMPDILYRLALNGRPSTPVKDPPKLDTHNFDAIPWVRRSYVGIFFDEANWSFHKRRDGISSVVFNPIKGDPNDSFFDAKDVDLRMPNEDAPDGIDRRSAVYFVNHMKGNWNGATPGSTPRSYKFDMWLTATFADASETGMSVNFDPGGTNQGPPLSP